MELNRHTLRKLRGLILFTVAIVILGINYRGVLHLAGQLLHVASPFILGGAIAFILNVPMRTVETCLGRLMKPESRLKRPLSLVVTLFLVTGVLFLVFFVVTPQLFRTVLSLQSSIPSFLMGIRNAVEQIFTDNPQIQLYLDQTQADWSSLINGTVNVLKNGVGSMLNTTVTAVMSIVSGLSAFLIAFIFAIYILLQKETLGRQVRKLLYAFLDRGTVELILQIASLTERTFSNFLAGQCVEAVILGTMFFVTLSVLRLPYSLLIGVLIAFTALIPVFGAFIGLGVGVFLMLMTSPVDALIFTVVFFVLQQIEGNLIYPHVVGNSVGLPSIWVLAAVTLGGSLMGVVGMLVFIPLCSVFYALLKDTVNERLSRKMGRKTEETESKKGEA